MQQNFSTSGELAGQEAWEDRLETVLQGRPMSPWAQSIGLSTGTGHRLKKGKFPDPESLIPAIRMDRVSLSWLVDGQGPPFMVLTADNDQEAAANITAMLSDEPQQTVTLIRSRAGNRQSVALTQPAQLEREGKFFEYIAVQIIAGPIGQHSMNSIATHARGDLRMAYLEPIELARLAGGLMGNVPLVGWHRQPGGIIEDATAITSAMLVKDRQRIEEPATDYLPATLPSDPDTLEAIDIIQQLSPTTRALILTMLRPLKP